MASKRCAEITSHIRSDDRQVPIYCSRAPTNGKLYCWQHDPDRKKPRDRLKAENAELREYVAFFNSLVQDRNIGTPGANRPSLRSYMEELEAENAKLKELAKAMDTLLAVYRVGGRPTEKTLDTIRQHRHLIQG